MPQIDRTIVFIVIINITIVIIVIINIVHLLGRRGGGGGALDFKLRGLSNGGKNQNPK